MKNEEQCYTGEGFYLSPQQTLNKSEGPGKKFSPISMYLPNWYKKTDICILN